MKQHNPKTPASSLEAGQGGYATQQGPKTSACNCGGFDLNHNPGCRLYRSKKKQGQTAPLTTEQKMLLEAAGFGKTAPSESEVVGDLTNCEYCGGFGNNHSKVCIVLELSTTREQLAESQKMDDELTDSLNSTLEYARKIAGRRDVHSVEEVLDQKQRELAELREIAGELAAALVEAHFWIPDGSRMTPEQRGAKCETAYEVARQSDAALAKAKAAGISPLAKNDRS